MELLITVVHLCIIKRYRNCNQLQSCDNVPFSQLVMILNGPWIRSEGINHELCHTNGAILDEYYSVYNDGKTLTLPQICSLIYERHSLSVVSNAILNREPLLNHPTLDQIMQCMTVSQLCAQMNGINAHLGVINLQKYRQNNAEIKSEKIAQITANQNRENMRENVVSLYLESSKPSNMCQCFVIGLFVFFVTGSSNGGFI